MDTAAPDERYPLRILFCERRGLRCIEADLEDALPLPADFEAECLYRPEAWFLHDLIELDADAGRVVARCDTTRLGALVDAQIELPAHPKHLPGAVALQITSTLASLHAVYLMDMRPSQGWAGFGTHVHSLRFPRMGRIGPPVDCTLELISRRTLRATVFTRYRFTYRQEGEVVYESEQTAAWVRK